MNENPVAMWTREEGVDVATVCEQVAKDCGAHVALTGGLLYKSGLRKDCDIVVYRIRQVANINVPEFFRRLEALGIQKTTDHGFVVKATWRFKNIDFLFPEHETPSDYLTQERQ